MGSSGGLVGRSRPLLHDAGDLGVTVRLGGILFSLMTVVNCQFLPPSKNLLTNKTGMEGAERD